MKIVLVVAAAIGLLLTIVPSVLVAIGRLEWQSHANLMTIGMFVWFAATGWYSRKQGPS